MKNLSAFWAAAAGVAVGIVLFAVLGAGTIEDSGIFQSLKLGGKTNLISDDGAALTYNGTHYQISSATLTNASTNAFTGAGLIVLQSAVPANQTNVAAANPTATVSTTAVNGSAGTFMRSDASPAIPAAFIQANQTNETTASITNKLGGFSGATGSYLGADGLFHTVTSGQTNDGTANWSASGTTNSDLVGTAGAYNFKVNGQPILNSFATNLIDIAAPFADYAHPTGIRIYNINNGSSYERTFIGYESNLMLYQTESGGSGATRQHVFKSDSTTLEVLNTTVADFRVPVTTTSSFTSGAPSGGTAAAWKLGTVVTGASVTLVTTNYIQLDIGGTLYKVAIVQ